MEILNKQKNRNITNLINRIEIKNIFSDEKKRNMIGKIGNEIYLKYDI